MRKKITIVGIVCVLLLSGLGASAIQSGHDQEFMIRTKNISISEPVVEEKDVAILAGENCKK